MGEVMSEAIRDPTFFSGPRGQGLPMLGRLRIQCLEIYWPTDRNHVFQNQLPQP